MYGEYIKLAYRNDSYDSGAGSGLTIDNYSYSDLGFIKDWNGGNTNIEPNIGNGYACVHEITIINTSNPQEALIFYAYNNYDTAYDWRDGQDGWNSMIQECANSFLVIGEKDRWWNSAEIVQIATNTANNTFTVTDISNGTTSISYSGRLFSYTDDRVQGTSRLNNTSQPIDIDSANIKSLKRISVPIDGAPVEPGVGGFATGGMKVAGDNNIYNMYKSDQVNNWVKFNGEETGLLELLLTGNAGSGDSGNEYGTGSKIRISGKTFNSSGNPIDYTVDDYLCMQCWVEQATSSTYTENYGNVGAGTPVAHIKIYTIFRGSEYTISETYLATRMHEGSGAGSHTYYVKPTYVDYCFVKKNGKLLIQYTVRAGIISGAAQQKSYYFFTHIVTQENVFKCKTLTKMMLPDGSFGSSNYLLQPYKTEEDDLNYILVEGDSTGGNTKWAGFFDFNVAYCGHNPNITPIGTWRTTSTNITLSFSSSEYSTYKTLGVGSYLHDTTSPTRITLTASGSDSPSVTLTEKAISTVSGTVLGKKNSGTTQHTYKETCVKGYMSSDGLKLNGYCKFITGGTATTYGTCTLTISKIEQLY